MAKTVMIGSARIDENGNAHGGKAGDQKNGKEVSAQEWYKHSKGWRVFRAKVKISENTDSDQKTSSAGKIFTPPLKTKKAQKPRGYRVFEPFDDKKELHLDCIQY